MTVDLSTLKVGDTVHNRRGVVSVVNDVYQTTDTQYEFAITLDGQFDTYTRAGMFHGSYDSGLDILAITPLVDKETVPMTVDLSVLKVGDNVHFRDGTVSLVTNLEPWSDSVYPFLVTLNGVKGCEVYTQNGRYLKKSESAFDIVAITPLVVKEPAPSKPAPKLSELFFGTDAAPAEGTKFDDGKPRFELIPEESLEQIALALGYGAKKYEDDWNWYQGFDYGRVYGAARRHMGKWQLGEDLDPASGINHLAHAACNLLFLLSFQINGVGTDDRNKRYIKKR